MAADPTSPTAPEPPTPDEVQTTLRVLQRLAADRALLAHVDPEDRRALFEAAGRVAIPTDESARRLRRALRRKERKEERDQDQQVRETAGVREQRRLWKSTGGSSPPQLPGDIKPPKLDEEPRLNRARGCYVCKQPYDRIHAFYDAMCPACGDFNFAKRTQTADLRGRVAYLSGARLKIGYQCALKMLRAGCQVVISTRFPVDAAQRYAKEPDFAEWKDRLQVFGLDLRHSPSVELFCHYLTRTLPKLDFIINNAAQTVRRPPAFYAHLLPTETAPIGEQPREVRQLLEGHQDIARSLHGGPQLLGTSSTEGEQIATVIGALSRHAPGMGMWGSAQLSQLPYSHDDAALGAEVFPRGQLDMDQQQVDLRSTNSWRLRLHEVPIPELIEVHLVNTVAPFILNARLKPLLLKDPTFDRHVVNVSAMEGQFYRGTKTDKHPHTNMAKAALNMMTRTSAADYAKDGIFMNAVDTGWVTDEDPAAIASRKEEELGFQPPLDIVDGAARVLDPIFHGLNTGEHLWGRFFKDYKVTDW